MFDDQVFEYLKKREIKKDEKIKRILNINSTKALELILSDEEIMQEFNGKDCENILIKSNLDDMSRLKILKTNNYIQEKINSWNVLEVFKVCDEELKQKVLMKENIEEYGLLESHVCKLVMLINDDFKKLEIVAKGENSMTSASIVNIIKTINDNLKRKVLENKNAIKKFKLKQEDITNIIISFENDRIKLEIGNKVDCNMIAVLSSCKDDCKIKILMKSSCNLSQNDIITILKSMEVQKIVEIIKNDEEFKILSNAGIELYQIVKDLMPQKQFEIMKLLSDMEMDKSKKRRLYACLKAGAKEKIDKRKLTPEITEVLDISVKDGFIEINLYDDFKKYKDLDPLIKPIRGMYRTQEDKEQIEELVQICPNVLIADKLGSMYLNSQEYFKAEKWIEEVLENVDRNWTNIQKIAYIDNSIGKKISYSEEYGTEAFDIKSSINIWKIICNEKGICTGIAELEKYMLDRIGVRSNILRSDNHEFLKLVNLEFEDEKGILQFGNSVLDPTWNLTEHKFGGCPHCFCRSYKEIRKLDISSKGKDNLTHKNDELEDCALDISLCDAMNVYKSIGVIDEKEELPLRLLSDKSKQIDMQKYDVKSNLKKQLNLFKGMYPNFSKDMDSTMYILNKLLNSKNMYFKKYVIDKVYNKADYNKKAVMYIYMNLDNEESLVYFIDKSSNQFINIPLAEFEKNFSCYDTQLEKNNGYTPWEILKGNKIKIQENKQLEYEVG